MQEKNSKRQRTEMNDLLPMVGHKIRQDVHTTTRQWQEHTVLDETKQEMLGAPRQKAYEEYNNCCSRAHLNITTGELESAVVTVLKKS